MKEFMILLTLLALSCTSAWAVPKRETRRGFLVVQDKKLFFTDVFHSTAPLYPLKWWNGKQPVPLCAVNLNSGCPSFEISFKRQVISGKNGKQTIFTNAIYTDDVKSEISLINGKKKSTL